MKRILTTISVIDNNYRYISDCLKGFVLQNKFDILDIILIFSNDINNEIIKKIKDYFKKYENIKFVELKYTNVYEAYNYSIKNYSELYEYMNFFYIEDIPKFDFIENTFQFLEENRDYIATGSFVEFIEDNNLVYNINNINNINNIKIDAYKIDTLYERIRNKFYERNSFYLSSVLFRSQYLKLFPDSIHFEYEFFTDFVFYNKICNIELNLIQYRFSLNRYDFWNNNYYKNIEDLRVEYKNRLYKEKSINKSKNIAIIIVATKNYKKFVFNTLNKKDKLFENHNVYFYVFTDEPDVFNNIKNVYPCKINHMVWPAMTIFRYNFILSKEEELKKMDYIYYMDADMSILGDIGDEIFGEIVVCRHAWQFELEPIEYCYDRNILSNAYVKEGEEQEYFYGTFQGGSSKKFLEMCKILSDSIKTDLERSYITIWQDESHLNRYLIDNPPDKILDVSFAVPFDDPSMPCYLNQYIHDKLGVVYKNNYSIREGCTYDDFFEHIDDYYSHIYKREYPSYKTSYNSLICIYCDLSYPISLYNLDYIYNNIKNNFSNLHILLIIKKDENEKIIEKYIYNKYENNIDVYFTKNIETILDNILLEKHCNKIVGFFNNNFIIDKHCLISCLIASSKNTRNVIIPGFTYKKIPNIIYKNGNTSLIDIKKQKKDFQTIDYKDNIFSVPFFIDTDFLFERKNENQYIKYFLSMMLEENKIINLNNENIFNLPIV